MGRLVDIDEIIARKGLSKKAIEIITETPSQMIN